MLTFGDLSFLEINGIDDLIESKFLQIQAIQRDGNAIHNN